MPLYEYQCQECGRRTEKIQKFSDAALTECPHCGGRIERTITAPAFQFKGGGWYKDLYSSAKPAGGSGEGTKSSETGSESKPAESKPSAEGGSSSSAPAPAPAASPSPAPAAKG